MNAAEFTGTIDRRILPAFSFDFIENKVSLCLLACKNKTAVDFCTKTYSYTDINNDIYYKRR